MAIDNEELLVKISADISQLQSSLRKVGKEFDGLGKGAGDALTKASQQMQQTGKKIADTGKTMTLGLTAPLIAAGGAMVKTYADFEQQLSNIKAVSGATNDDMAKLEKMAMDLGASTKYSAKEAAAGMNELIKSGLSVEQVLNGGIEGALTLAAAGELELADAAEIASTALNAFKKDNLSVADAANILAGAANASATDVGELKYGLSAVSAVAAGAGMNFNDTATALAAFAQSGLKGSDAGTSLKTMIMNLIPSTKAQIEEFDRLGLVTFDTQEALKLLAENGMKPLSNSTTDIENAMMKLAAQLSGSKVNSAKAQQQYSKLAWQAGVMGSAFYDAEGHIKSFEEIAGILQDSLSGMTDAQRSMSLEIMFGSDAIRAGNIAFKEGAEGIKKMNSEMLKVTAADVAKTKMDNLKGTIEEMNGAIETASIQLGKAMAPIVRDVAESIGDLAEDFSKLDDETKANILKFGAMAIAAGPLTYALGKVTSVVGGVVGILGKLPIAANPMLFAIAGVIGAIQLFNGTKAENPIDPVHEEFMRQAKEMQEQWYGLQGDFDNSVFKIRMKTELGEALTKEDLNAIRNAVQEQQDMINKELGDDKSQGKDYVKNVRANKKFYVENYELVETSFKGINKAQASLDKDKKQVENYANEINKALDAGLSENVEIREKQLQYIEGLQEKMAELGEKNMEELQVDIEASKIKATQATGDERAGYVQEAIQKANDKETRGKIEVEKQYNDDLAFIIQGRGEMSEEEYNAAIEVATRTKDDKLAILADEKDQTVEALNDMFDNLDEVIDTRNGQLIEKQKGWAASLGDAASEGFLKDMANYAGAFDVMFGNSSVEEAQKQADKTHKLIEEKYKAPELELRKPYVKVESDLTKEQQIVVVNEFKGDLQKFFEATAGKITKNFNKKNAGRG